MAKQRDTSINNSRLFIVYRWKDIEIVLKSINRLTVSLQLIWARASVLFQCIFLKTWKILSNQNVKPEAMK